MPATRRAVKMNTRWASDGAMEEGLSWRWW
jgi:hypothetical protein